MCLAFSAQPAETVPNCLWLLRKVVVGMLCVGVLGRTLLIELGINQGSFVIWE